MKPRSRNLFLVISALAPLAFCGLTHAATVTYDADTSTTAAQDGAGIGWNTTNTNFWNSTTSANVVWPNTTADEAIFGAASGAAGTVTVGAVSTNKITFNAPGSGSYSLSGGTITFIGTTPTLTANVDASIGSVLAGTAGLTKAGTGSLTLTGSNTYSGVTTISNGSLTYPSGGSTGAGNLSLGTAATNRGVLNMNSSGTVTHNGNVIVGGATTGAGAINQTAGTVNLRNDAGYLQLGNGGYGSYNISGGTLNFTSASGARIGDGSGGLGSYVQSGGTVNLNRYFAIGGPTATAPKGVATFTGGTINGPTGQWFILGNAGTASGTLNLGTSAGGSATVVSKNANGIRIGDSGNAGTMSGVINLNSGTIQFNAGGINRVNSNNGTTVGIVNLNGGTLKANAAGLTLLDNTPTSVNVFNGGLKVDTQANSATVSANLLITTGNGLYPAGGVINQPSATGAGYIGAPLVTVTSSGAGTGATAIANISGGQVTGVTLTSPGQGYLVGDTVTFAFAGGGSTSAASSFVYTLTASDLAANGTGGLTKLGSGTLTLSGANTFTGSVSIEGTLAPGSLNLSNSTLTVNGGGKLVSPSLSLSGSTLSVHNLAPTTASTVPIQISTSLTTSGTVPVQVDGSAIVSAGQWPLIYYPIGGSIGGSGFSALQLQTGTLPRGVTTSLVDNTGNSSVDLLVAVNPLTWKGSADGNWDIDTTSNWKLVATAEKYKEGDVVLFNDSATGPTSVALNVTVNPQNVTFDNDAKSYTLTGTGAIAGTGGLTKSNNGTVTLLTANTYSGITSVSGGTLELGDGSTTGSIAGALANEATVVFNPSGTSTYAGAISGSGSGTFNKTGSGTQVLTGGNTSSGAFHIIQGILQIGNGTLNGSTSGTYQIDSGTSLRLERATAVAPTWANISGAGTLVLNSAQAVNASADWGTLGLPSGFTGTLRVEKGRVNTSGGNTVVGGSSLIQVLSGAQFLAFSSTNPYTTPIEIAGTGWGETGYPGGLRLAAIATATWAGNVTLTTDSGITAQRGSSFTVSGPITGAYQCEFYAGDPQGDSGTLTIAPANPVQNSYASTKINGTANASIVAGNAYAFSSGPLVVSSAILKLNGNSLSFANLSGTGGKIGNYHVSAPVVLTVGGDGTNTAYSGGLLDGGTAKLGLTKTGAGTLTLTGSLAYSGDTTVNGGTLSISTASLNDNATVSIASGAKIDLPNAGSDTVGKLFLGGTEVPAGTYNSSHATYGSYFTGAGSLVVVGGYSSWAALMGLDGTPGKENGLTADPDHDGVSNLVEFYLNGNPLSSDPSILPALVPNATYLTMTFSRRDDAAADLTSQSIQYGSNLAGWTNVPITAGTDANGVIVAIATNGTNPDTITVQIPKALAAGDKLFGRLQVTK